MSSDPVPAPTASLDTALIRRRLDWGLVAPDRLGYVPVNAEAVRDDVTVLCDEVDRLRRALAGHLFDGESLGTREAIRSELIKQGFALVAKADRHARALRSIAADLEMQLPGTSAELRQIAADLAGDTEFGHA